MNSYICGIGMSIGGSVVECSPATRAARVRFPADADTFLLFLKSCYRNPRLEICIQRFFDILFKIKSVTFLFVLIFSMVSKNT